MLNNLFKLYSSNTSKTPLEDFTTEAFAGILRFDDEILRQFILNFLKLPTKNKVYKVKTQVRYTLLEDTDCIIDLVLESLEDICFIENKVNSPEGDRQLERYCKVLDTYNKEGVITHLKYCTKYHDDKIVDSHKFDQFRWFQVAKFLKQYSNNNIVNDFLSFLNSQNMSQELTITTKDLLSIENLCDTVNILKG